METFFIYRIIVSINYVLILIIMEDTHGEQTNKLVN